MERKERNTSEGIEQVRIESLEDLINLNLRTLEKVVDGSMDNRKAQLIFTGSRTVTSSLKLGLEAMKLGMGKVGGVQMSGQKLIEEKPTEKDAA